MPYGSSPAWGPPPASLSLGERPAVYGYVRTVARGRARVWHWQRDLRLFCDEAGLRLVHCFCDVGRHQPEGYSRSRLHVELAPGKYDRDIRSWPLLSASVRPLPAFRVLLSILEQRTVYGVVVPSVFHLATERDIAISFMQYIERLGKKVLVVPESGVGVRSQYSGLFDAHVDTELPFLPVQQNGSQP